MRKLQRKHLRPHPWFAFSEKFSSFYHLAKIVNGFAENDNSLTSTDVNTDVNIPPTPPTAAPGRNVFE